MISEKIKRAAIRKDCSPLTGLGRGAAGQKLPVASMRDLEGVAYPGVDPVVG